MAKKINKSIKTEKSKTMTEVKKDEEAKTTVNDSYEKLRDELFEYRVDIQSYKRSMKMLWGSVSIVLALLGFFGYNHIESLLDKVEKNANERLAKTDSLLSKVDTQYLDSLMACVEERTAEYEKAIEAIERGTRINKELYRSLISGLPYNKRLDASVRPYIQNKDAANLFDIVFYNDSYSLNEIGECYVVMGLEYAKLDGDLFMVTVRPEDRNVIIYDQLFEVQDNFNKMHYSFDRFDKYDDYTLEVILLRKKGNETIGYAMRMPIKVK